MLVLLWVAALPFTLRQAYPVVAAVSGALGVLVAVYLILVRVTRRNRAP